MDHERQLRELAARQHQLVTRTQLADLGFTRAMVRSRLARGVLTAVHRDILRLEGVTPTWRQSVLAAVLASGAHAHASHRAGARLCGLEGPWRGVRPEVWVERGRSGARGLAVVHQTRRLAAVDRTVIDGIPVTTPARTLIDLGAICPPPVVEAALDAALRDGLVREPFLRWRLAELGGPGAAGSGTLRALLGPSASDRARTDSWLEARTLSLFRAARLPDPDCQRHLRPGTGTLLRVDFAFCEGRVVVEVNGHATHSTRRQRQLDHERATRLGLAGIHVLQFTYEDVVERPDYVVTSTTDAVRIASCVRSGRLTTGSDA